VLVATIIGIALVQSVVRTFSRYVIFNVGRDVEYDLRNDLFAHLERLPLAFYQERQTGDLMSRLVNDVNAVRMMLGPGLLTFINTPVYYATGSSTCCGSTGRSPCGAGPSAHPGVSGRPAVDGAHAAAGGLAELSARAGEPGRIHVVKAYACEGGVEDFSRAQPPLPGDQRAAGRVHLPDRPGDEHRRGVSTLVLPGWGGLRIMASTMSVGAIVESSLPLLSLWPRCARLMLSVLRRTPACAGSFRAYSVEPAIDSPSNATAPARSAASWRSATATFTGDPRPAADLDGEPSR
jgi:hypothetical protein